MAADGPVVLYDGACGFCHFWVRFALRRDPRGRLRFAPQQGQWAEAHRELLRLPPVPVSVLFFEAGRVYTESTATLRLVRWLRWPWPLLGVLGLVPRPLRDVAYRWVARHRFRFGARIDACLLPDPARRARFLP